jgi:flagellar biosynthetic protein FlhB
MCPGEKTEKATPRKRRKARSEGQVRKSTDVNTAVSLTVGFAALSMLGPMILRNIDGLMRNFLGGERIPVGTFQIPDIARLLGGLFLDLLLTILPLFAVAVIVGVAINILQVGWHFSSKSMRPKFSKMNPLKGLKRIVSLQTLFKLITNVIKVTIIGFVVYLEYTSGFPMFPHFMLYDVANISAQIFSLIINMAIRACVALIIISVVDFVQTWFSYEKKLKMTKQEVKDEYKMTEGDPKIKSKIKQQQRKMSMMRMMGAVPGADVVITNPTHYAVALKYDEKLGDAPVVLAKGADYVAHKIKEAAREAQVPIVENKPVAQALYAAVEVGQAIPGDMFAVVAEILAQVYKAKREKSSYSPVPRPV